jgi:hypothetical protein
MWTLREDTVLGTAQGYHGHGMFSGFRRKIIDNFIGKQCFNEVHVAEKKPYF